MAFRKSTKRNTIHFSCEDVAKARGVTVDAVYAAIKRGILDISDLGSVAKYVMKIKVKAATNKEVTERLLKLYLEAKAKAKD